MKNDILIRAAKGEVTERPPIWIMRQAGRILPEYRALRSKFSGFKDFIYTPEATAEATLQPVSALGVDAAIIFSDILVIPEALGCNYQMIESRGPVFDKMISGPETLKELRSAEEAVSKLEYVFDAIKLVKKDIKDELPLIGFAGAPWTIFAYMVEGKGSKDFSKAKKMLYTVPDASKAFLQRITDTTILYLREKIKHGCDILQLFDSWAGILSPAQFQEFSLPYLQQICKAFPEIPVIVFAKGAMLNLEAISTLSCNVIGLDWNIKMNEARNILGPIKVVQGNMDPCALYASVNEIEAMAQNIMVAAGEHHIFNLGHGVYPDTDMYRVKALIDYVKSYRY